MQQHFPPELVEAILRDRPVYVACKHKYDGSESRSRTLGVFFTPDGGRKAVLRDVFARLDFNHYDPAKRFYRCEQGYRNEMAWTDEWSRFAGVSRYRVETWLPEKGLRETSFFNFDDWFKRRMIEGGTPSAAARATLRAWRDSVRAGGLPPDLTEAFGATEVGRRWNDELPGDREAWVARFGSVPPYPCEGCSMRPEGLDDGPDAESTAGGESDGESSGDSDGGES